MGLLLGAFGLPTHPMSHSPWPHHGTGPFPASHGLPNLSGRCLALATRPSPPHPLVPSSRVYTPPGRQQPCGAGPLEPLPSGDRFVRLARVAPFPPPSPSPVPGPRPIPLGCRAAPSHLFSRVYTPPGRQQPCGAGPLDPHPSGDRFVRLARVAPFPPCSPVPRSGPAPPGRCSGPPVCTLCVWCCVYGVLGLLAPVHRRARSVCGVACTASWASWPLFTGVHALCVVLRVRCPGPPGSCSPVCTLCVWCCGCGVLGRLAPVHWCARSLCGVVCAVSWAAWLLFTGVPALVCCVVCTRDAGSNSHKFARNGIRPEFARIRGPLRTRTRNFKFEPSLIRLIESIGTYNLPSRLQFTCLHMGMRLRSTISHKRFPKSFRNFAIFVVCCCLHLPC